MQNGRLTPRELASIHHPTLGLFLAAREAAASWNTMRMFLIQRYGSHGDIYPEGPLGAYRNYAGQVRCRELYGSNAAVPGTSNHGLGHAVDVADHFMAGLVDKHGGLFGWHHWDAKWEWWHREYDGGFDRPDPGIDPRNPVVRKGSGGVGQAPCVERLQRRLNALGETLTVDGDFGAATDKAVRAFQRSHATPCRRRGRHRDVGRVGLGEARPDAHAEAQAQAEANPDADDATRLRHLRRPG